MKHFTFIAAGLALALSACADADIDVETGAHVVSTDAGEVRGKIAEDGSVIFYGIPFAAPPVGDLRWRAPQPVAPWEGVREATAPAPSCPQTDQGWNAFATVSMSEDCLYLNIRTPEITPDKPLPVMVWIHGGGNLAGAGMDVIEGTLHKQGVILVSTQYRLGALGFMAHPSLGAESDRGASGNYAFLDDQAALRWVQNNIARFGGDPDNITIFGESAGGHHIAINLQAEGSQGLFHRAIQESGTTNFGSPSRTLEEAEALGRMFAEHAGLEADADATSLRALPVAAILAAQDMTQPPEGSGGLYTAPVIDGAVLKEDPRIVLERGDGVTVPLIVGANAKEIPFFSDPDTTRHFVNLSFHDHAAKALEAYGLLEGGTPVDDPRLGDANVQAATDIYFRCPAVYTAKTAAAGGAPVWLYHFDHDYADQGVSHASELGFVFGYEEGPHLTTAPMQAYWANFAKTGAPNGDGLPAWPLYDEEARSYLEFSNDGPSAKVKLREPICDWLPIP